MLPSTIPHGATARRLTWAGLPETVRQVVADHCGSPVVRAVSQDAGFTPGFASVLVCADGSRHFVKAACARQQPLFVDAYREEARKLTHLPANTPAPRLRWTCDTQGWVVLGLEYVQSRTPHRPWRQSEVEAALTMLDEAADALTPPPSTLVLPVVEDEFASWPARWKQVRLAQPDLPHLDDLEALAAGYAEPTAGSTLVHSDVRDDNILICRDGRVLLCDWNSAVVGADWLDSLLLLIGPRGDGLDVQTLIGESRRLRRVPPDDIDAVLALFLGYFLTQATAPVPPTSPFLRDFQRWQADVILDWICQRRDWT